jgi:hypothetical protein
MMYMLAANDWLSSKLNNDFSVGKRINGSKENINKSEDYIQGMSKLTRIVI